MADVIDFQEKLEHLKDAGTTEVLQEVLNEANSIKDVLIFIKDVSEDYILFASTGIDIRDKAFLTKLLDHDIMKDLDSSTDLTFESDQ